MTVGRLFASLNLIARLEAYCSPAKLLIGGTVLAGELRVGWSLCKFGLKRNLSYGMGP